MAPLINILKIKLYFYFYVCILILHYKGFAKLAKWHEEVNQSGFKSFNTISRTIINHYQTILNYFGNRSTNASAESFNAKIKAFRSKFRGVRNIEYFLFRLTNIYA